jgi:uncharacterized protein YjiS (DUF1127 family)
MTQVILIAHNYSTKAIELIIESLSSFWKYLKFRNDVRETRNELYKLKDSELNDIGITRGDIEAIARGDVEFVRRANYRYLEPVSNPNLKGWS